MDQALVSGPPSAAYYIPNFITQEEQQQILSSIHQLPASRWTNLTHRRLLSLPSRLTGTARDTLISAPLPPYLHDPILPRFRVLDVFSGSPHHAPNHVLVNEYRAGEGIMPHEDGSAYFPLTATVSIGTHTVLDVYEKNDAGERELEPTWRILQEPGSLLVTSKTMYGETLHGIAEVEVDENLSADTIANWSMLGDPEPYVGGSAKRETRVSLTYRDVLKVAKLGGALKFIGKR